MFLMSGYVDTTSIHFVSRQEAEHPQNNQSSANTTNYAPSSTKMGNKGEREGKIEPPVAFTPKSFLRLTTLPFTQGAKLGLGDSGSKGSCPGHKSTPQLFPLF